MTRAGRWADFNYGPYLEGHRDFLISLKRVPHTVTASGLKIDGGPTDIFYLVLTTQYQDSKRKLVSFANSALLPDAVKQEVAALDGLVNEDAELMINTLDDRMHESDEYFLQNMSLNTPFYGVIQSDYAKQIKPLKPVADRSCGSVRISVCEAFSVSPPIGQVTVSRERPPRQARILADPCSTRPRSAPS